MQICQACRVTRHDEKDGQGQEGRPPCPYRSSQAAPYAIISGGAGRRVPSCPAVAENVGQVGP